MNAMYKRFISFQQYEFPVSVNIHCLEVSMTPPRYIISKIAPPRVKLYQLVIEQMIDIQRNEALQRRPTYKKVLTLLAKAVQDLLPRHQSIEDFLQLEDDLRIATLQTVGWVC